MAFSENAKSDSSFNIYNEIGLSTIESNPAKTAVPPLFYELEPAEVIDIILNNDHPEFDSEGGYEAIGKVKLRMIHSDFNKEKSSLPWASSLNSNIKNFPLKHEIVIAIWYLGRLWYDNRVNFYNNPNNNARPGTSVKVSEFFLAEEASSEEYQQIESSGTPNKQLDKEKTTLGKVFKEDKIIHPLHFFEGDYILEGRWGNSIRLGSSGETGKPNLKIRVGQIEEIPEEQLEPINENINDDKNSIWMTTDEEIEINTAFETIDNFKKNQITINSDRIVFNAKLENIKNYAKKSIDFFTKDIFTVTAEKDINNVTNTKYIINSPKIYLGEDNNEEQPIVLGKKLVDILNELLDAIMQETHPTGTGPSGPPVNIAQYQQIKSKINSILSIQNFGV